ncbi:MAG: hypothetical protein M3N50_13975 [Pseudomonadota bacterium]|nr:hypothetical protein [Pseudomonadota bacterium]
MRDLHDALAEIRQIRTQVARDTQFRGYGPASIAVSGLLALAVAAVQSHRARGGEDFWSFFTVWLATAFVTVVIVSVETMLRARRVHSELAYEMLHSAVEQFLPALVVGVLLTVVLARAAPQEIWMLPGLWQLIFSLGVFASCRFLPPQTFAVGVWYLIAGLVCLMALSGTRTLSPWSMGVPFGAGQLLVAAVLQFGFERSIEDT